MDRFLLYWSGGRPTGERLGEALGIEHGDTVPSRRYDYLIRWGSTQRVAYTPSIRTWNLRSAIQRNSNKFNSLVLLQRRGINVPSFSRDYSDLQFPVLGRSTNHMQGRDVQLILQSRDLTFFGPSDYYVQYVPKQREYRAHVIRGQIIQVYEKTVRPGEDDYNQVTCSNNSHWTRRDIREVHPDVYTSIAAVETLGLDFGAVDFILGEDDKVYFLEVNTAPGLEGETTFPLYVQRFKEMLEISD